jgi:branched-chain amino acid transport system substrate-binding protein
MPSPGSDQKLSPTRRQLIATGALAAPAILLGRRAAAADRVIKIGFVSPETGPLAPFSEPNKFVLDQVNAALKNGLAVAGKPTKVEIIVKDSQSNPNRAADVAKDLILGSKVDLLLTTSTPDTTNPVADAAEINGVPCISTDCPWQAYFFGRGGDPKKGFDYTYHFFWGLEDIIAAYTDLWDSVPTNRVVGGLFPNDTDGNAWADPKFGLLGALPAANYKIIDGGRFQDMSSDFSAQISAFKAANAEIVTGVLIPPDFATFWAQAAQQGFKPKIVTIGKALLFPSTVASLGDRGVGLSSEVWWTPDHPFKSGLTGQTSKQLCDAYTKATNRVWTQPIGFTHALFEVAIDVLKRTKKIDDADSIMQAVTSTDYNSVVGHINWKNGPVKNVCKTPVVSGQWQKQGNSLDLKVVNNKPAPEIPVGSKLELLA